MGLLTRNPDDTADSAVSPFPLYADEKNTYRFDAWDAMAWHHVYRDRWEREIAPTKNFNEVRRNSFDYPELRGFIEAMNGLPSLHKPIPHDGFSRDGPPGVNLPTWTFDMDAPVPRRPSTSVGSDTTDESTRSHKSEDGETDSQHAL